MAQERENSNITSLKSTEYSISGNVFRAYVDDSDRLIFVVDFTIDASKPNTMLIIDPDEDRKWDDILSNDYNIDLETIRPKQDNKYQKLDIEYTGLDIYNNLINAYESNADTSEQIANLHEFRIASVRRIAKDRLAVAEKTIETTSETIAKTNESIQTLNQQLRDLRTKLKTQRESIGREPTKQSASKILRTESQIDATSEKIERAQKRLANAKHRLAIATSDADAARNILTQEPITQGTQMADNEEEVKPLFDKDPEIMNDDIAFQPIDFNDTQLTGTQPAQPQSEPLSFTPPTIDNSTNIQEPVAAQNEIQLDDTFTEFTPAEPVAPVLNTIKPVETPAQLETATPAPTAPVAPVAQVAPVQDDFRPASPVSGVYGTSASTKSRKPNIMYYILLILLIGLSIFTLWMYQKSVENTQTPNLVSEQKTDVQPVPNVPETTAPQVAQNIPTIVATQSDTVTPPIMPEPVQISAPIVEPEPVIVEPVVVEPVVVEPVVVEPVKTEVEPVPVPVEPLSDTKTEDVVVTPVKEESLKSAMDTFFEPVVDKPEYSVTTQNEEMFISEEDYNSPDNLLCADNQAPDENGCCTGEEYTEMESGGFACCPISGGDCFPPMK